MLDIAYLEIKDSNGKGFVSGNLQHFGWSDFLYAIKNGENSSYPRVEKIQMITNSNNGIGFDAYAGIEGRDGGDLMVTLTKQGLGIYDITDCNPSGRIL